MVKKYFKEILICFALVVGFGCGWYGCKAYARHKIMKAIDQLDKEMAEYCDSVTNTIENDTTMNDTITGCEF
jgi:hypothetical protein